MSNQSDSQTRRSARMHMIPVDPNMSIEEAEEILRKFKENFPGVNAFIYRREVQTNE